jgi:hypothetical protein
MLEPQDGFDLLVGKITRCGDFPYALPHRLFELAPMSDRFGWRLTPRESGAKQRGAGSGPRLKPALAD